MSYYSNKGCPFHQVIELVNQIQHCDTTLVLYKIYNTVVTLRQPNTSKGLSFTIAS